MFAVGWIVREEFSGEADGSDFNAAQEESFLPGAQDEFGGAAADIDNDVGTILKGDGGEDAEVNAAGFFLTGHEVDGNPQFAIDALEKFLTVGGFPSCAGGDGNDRFSAVRFR